MRRGLSGPFLILCDPKATKGSCEERRMSKEMSGAEIVIQALVDQGVRDIFGYPGGAVLPIYDALFQQDKLRHVLVRHEQGAVHAAEGYARSTGKVGCVLVTSGPGATNAVTGLTDALMDSVPLVVITGQVPTHLIGNDAFQECDTVGITRPCTKHNYLVKNVADLARVLHEAFYVAAHGRPGPVVVDIPKDIQFAKGFYQGPQNIEHKTYKPRVKGDPAKIKTPFEIMRRAAPDPIDTAPSSSNKQLKVDLGIVGDCANVLPEMVSLGRASPAPPDKKPLAAWWKQIETWRARKSLAYTNSTSIIKPQYAIQRLYELTKKRDVYITTEVGQHQMWAAQFYRFEEPNRSMTSGGLGTMGYGLPAPIGGQRAHPEALGIDIAGEA